MNKRDLVGKIAEGAQITRSQAALALDAFMQSVQSGLIQGDRVTLVGFGTFAVSSRKARSVRDPHNGTTIRIAARRVARFSPGVELKAAIEKTMDTGHTLA
ncbi:MAG: HU family DNA-binding protein [Bryobacteraceae bacterium]